MHPNNIRSPKPFFSEGIDNKDDRPDRRTGSRNEQRYKQGPNPKGFDGRYPLHIIQTAVILRVRVLDC